MVVRTTLKNLGKFCESTIPATLELHACRSHIMQPAAVIPAVAGVAPPEHSWGLHSKKTNMRFKKFVKLTGYTYACNTLTNFEYEVHAMTGNVNQVNLMELA